MSVSPEQIGMAAFAVPATVAVMDKWLPALHEVRHRSDATMALDVRMGEIALGAWLVGVGAYLTWALRSRHPIILAGAGLALIVAVYETALSSRTAQEG